MHPGWICAIVAVVAPFVFLICHCFMVHLEGHKYEFPVKIHWTIRPKFCRHCGKDLRKEDDE